MAENYVHPCSRRQVIRIDVLPDEVLLAIFDFYVVEYQRTKREVEKWQSLVHVCRRWRRLVFGSPRRLNLRLFCTPETPARDTLDVWPSLPLLIYGNTSLASSVDNIVAALGHNHRIHEVDLWQVANFQLEKVLARMQVPFPEVTHLRLSMPQYDQTLLAVPDSFLGGSAPSLRFFSLNDIPFPGLSKFLLSISTTHLVNLDLRIPHSGYIPPEAIVTCLSVLTSLDECTLNFQSFQPHPDRETQRSPLATCSVLPALSSLHFEGSSGYLEDLVARIDAPRLYDFYTIFNYQTNISIPQLFKFISRTPALKAPLGANAVFERDVALVELMSQTSGEGEFLVEIPCRRPDWQLSSLVQVLASSSCPCPLSTVESLYIEDQDSSLTMSSRVEITQWWEFLRPFVAVKNIYLCQTTAFHIAYSLQELGGGRSIEVLPALQKIFVRPPQFGPPVRCQELTQFVAARQLSGHSITITTSRW